MAQVFLTRIGYERLSAELHDLLNVRRPQVMADLTQAREYGDISENAEYDIAKRDQSIIEGRIHELQALLSSVQIIEPPRNSREAVIGLCVRVENIDFGQQREYTLVTEHESHLLEEYLSVDSPLGKALVGSKVGDTVIFEAPAGTRKFRVLELTIPQDGELTVACEEE
ncbi:MAG: transcription elongation factor GreA [Armatimonadota bacterium]